jgi:hypothetical protein
MFLEEGFVGGEFFRRTCSANGDLLDNSRFDGNIYFDGWGHISHVAFLESIGDRDRVIELIYMP